MSSELPQNRIKKIIKLDPNYSGISLPAVHLMSKATELFIQDLASKASIETRRQQRKKINYEDFFNVIKSNSSLYFLSDVVPKRYKVRELIANKNIQIRSEQQLDDDILIDEPQEGREDPNPVRRQGILAFTNSDSAKSTPEVSNSEVAKAPIPDATLAPVEVQVEAPVTVQEQTTVDEPILVEESDDDEEMIDS